MNRNISSTTAETAPRQLANGYFSRWKNLIIEHGYETFSTSLKLGTIFLVLCNWKRSPFTSSSALRTAPRPWAPGTPPGPVSSFSCSSRMLVLQPLGWRILDQSLIFFLFRCHGNAYSVPYTHHLLSGFYYFMNNKKNLKFGRSLMERIIKGEICCKKKLKS